MIHKIRVNTKKATIKTGFELILNKLTILNGVNNAGKTNFMSSVGTPGKVDFLDDAEQPMDVEVVYVAANNINPSETEAKSSAEGANLIKNLSKLFSNLGITFELTEQQRVLALMQDVANKASDNMKEILQSDMYRLEMENKVFPKDVVIQKLIDNIHSYEGVEKRKLDELGQGTQRMIIISMLKAYLDLLIANGDLQKPILIVIEEPEVYLHPRWKRMFNKVIQQISGKPNHQVLVSTHDPYFVFKNFMSDDVSVQFFAKDDSGMTENPHPGVCGLEDELLFIMMYGTLLDKNASALRAVSIGSIQARRGTYVHKDNPSYVVEHDLQYIRDQIHHPDNPNTEGLVANASEATKINYFTESELREAIGAMSEALELEKQKVAA